MSCGMVGELDEAPLSCWYSPRIENSSYGAIAYLGDTGDSVECHSLTDVRTFAEQRMASCIGLRDNHLKAELPPCRECRSAGRLEGDAAEQETAPTICLAGRIGWARRKRRFLAIHVFGADRTSGGADRAALSLGRRARFLCNGKDRTRREQVRPDNHVRKLVTILAWSYIQGSLPEPLVPYRCGSIRTRTR